MFGDPSYQEVYDILSHTTWKDVFEIIDELADKKGKDLREYSPILSVNRYLGKMVRGDLAEERVKEISEELLRMRRGTDAVEFKLTDKGFRKRFETAEKSESLPGLLSPSPA